VDTTGTVVKITGTPGGPPIAPNVDPATQLELTFVYVPAGATAPPVTNVNIYLENTEWTSSVSAGTINPASTNNPYAGTKDIEGTSVANGQYVNLANPGAPIQVSNYTNLILQLRSKASWPNQKAMSVYWGIGTAVTLKNGTFGFNSGNTTGYQQIVIPVSLFNTGSSLASFLRFTVTGGGGNIGWYIDNVILQGAAGGGGGPPSGGDFSTNTNVSVPGELVEFADTTGKVGKRSTGTGLATLANGVIGLVAMAALTRGLNFISGNPAVGKIAGYFTFPFAGTISGWSINIKNTDVGTIALRFWKIAAGTAVPTVANNINTSGVQLSTGTHIRSTVVTDFITLAVAAGDIMAVEVFAMTGTISELSGTLEVTPT
jgi:hypothetical protein